MAWRNTYHLLLCFALILSSQFAAAQHTLEVSGNLVAKRHFTLDQLAALPQTELTETRTIDNAQQTVSWRGVLLRDLVNAAGYREKERHDFRHTLIVAKARDNYVALFSWGELFNTKLGESVLVITAVDGKPLTDDEGPFALRSLADTRPGPRHVKWLDRIQVIFITP